MSTRNVFTIGQRVRLSAAGMERFGRLKPDLWTGRQGTVVRWLSDRDPTPVIWWDGRNRKSAESVSVIYVEAVE